MADALGMHAYEDGQVGRKVGLWGFLGLTAVTSGINFLGIAAANGGLIAGFGAALASTIPALIIGAPVVLLFALGARWVGGKIGEAIGRKTDAAEMSRQQQPEQGQGPKYGRSQAKAEGRIKPLEADDGTYHQDQLAARNAQPATRTSTRFSNW